MPRTAGGPRTDPTPAHHRLYAPSSQDGPGPIAVEGDEAHHAVRVKRLKIGELVELFDGRGTVRPGSVAAITGSRQHPVIEVEPTAEAAQIAAVAPRVEVWSPAPKGDRLERMLDQLSQAGAAAWRPLATNRAEDNQPKKPDRLVRVTIESAKQCGRAHLLELGAPATLDAAIGRPGVVAAYQGAKGAQPPEPDASGTLILLVGPEGGWSEPELRQLADGAVPFVTLGPHVLRLETAAVVGAAALLANHSVHPKDTP